jgi:isopropylmalate/homocitrate/citramalate synthase
MVRTIPIVEYEFAFEQLKELGIPLLIVESWDDLSPEFLEQQYSKMDVDWNTAIYLCSTQGVTNLIQQHT